MSGNQETPKSDSSRKAQQQPPTDTTEQAAASAQEDVEEKIKTGRKELTNLQADTSGAASQAPQQIQELEQQKKQLEQNPSKSENAEVFDGLKSLFAMLKQIIEEFKSSIESSFSFTDQMFETEGTGQKEKKEESQSEKDIKKYQEKKQQEQNKYFSDIDIKGFENYDNDRDSDDRKLGDGKPPYRFWDGGYGWKNSGNFGTRSGRKDYKDELAIEQLKRSDARVVFTFGRHRNSIANIVDDAVPGSIRVPDPERNESLEDIRGVASRLSAPNSPPMIVCPIVLDTDGYWEANELCYTSMGACIEAGHELHCCCDHGAHRAVIAIMCALLIIGRASSVGEAYLLAGGDISKFSRRSNEDMNTHYRTFFGQAVQCAKDMGRHCEPMFEEFVNNHDYALSHKTIENEMLYS